MHAIESQHVAPMSVDQHTILAVRLDRHGLLRREAPPDLDAAIPLGLQDTAVGAASQALAVRLPDLGPSPVEHLVSDGRLVATFGPRAASTLVTPDDEELVAAALLDPDPPRGGDEFAPLVDDLARSALPPLREHGPMTKAEIGEAIASEVPDQALRDCVRCERRHPDDGLVKMLLWSNRIRLEPTEASDSRVASAAHWRPRLYRRVRDGQRPELVRRFLWLHGPATADDLADWAGISTSYARRCWGLVEDEVEPVDTDRGRAWVMGLNDLRDPPDPGPTRLVPADDPLLQSPDRASLVPERVHQRAVWRSVANPGVVVADHTVVGTWRGRTRGRRFDITISPFDGHAIALDEVEPDARRIALARGREAFDLALD